MVQSERIIQIRVDIEFKIIFRTAYQRSFPDSPNLTAKLCGAESWLGSAWEQWPVFPSQLHPRSRFGRARKNIIE